MCFGISISLELISETFQTFATVQLDQKLNFNRCTSWTEIFVYPKNKKISASQKSD